MLHWVPLLLLLIYIKRTLVFVALVWQSSNLEVLDSKLNLFTAFVGVVDGGLDEVELLSSIYFKLTIYAFHVSILERFKFQELKVVVLFNSPFLLFCLLEGFDNHHWHVLTLEVDLDRLAEGELTINLNTFFLRPLLKYLVVKLIKLLSLYSA